MQLNSAYFQSKVLQSAVELGLFEMLAQRPATADEVAEQLKIRPRMTPDFLDALVGLNLLTRAGGRYALGDGVGEFLTSSGGHYIGGSIVQHARKHYRLWADLTQSLQDMAAEEHVLYGTDSFLKVYENHEVVRGLMNHMDTYNGFVAPQLATAIDWSGYRSFVDLGGARGNVAALLVSAVSHLTGGVYDLPPVKPLFDEHMAKHGTAERVTFHGGDFVQDTLPETDVIIIGHVLHDWPPEYREKIIGRTFAAIRPGGALLVYDAMLDDARTEAPALLQSLNCRVLSRGGGSEYSAEDCRGWMEKAGFRYDTVVDLETVTNDRVVVARKPA
ncbi:methyltransferase [Micromonospora sp. NPDC050200]|uniref:methyltransferase n=1 Tax=Micromonospora sp. NPDC050200 TaxID=3155664 RepID=UPI0034034554